MLQNSIKSPTYFPTWFLWVKLSHWAWGSQAWIPRLTRNFQWSFCLHPPSIRIIGGPCNARLLCGCWSSILGPTYLCCMYFTNIAIGLIHILLFNLYLSFFWESPIWLLYSHHFYSSIFPSQNSHVPPIFSPITELLITIIMNIQPPTHSNKRTYKYSLLSSFSYNFSWKQNDQVNQMLLRSWNKNCEADIERA